MESNPNPLVFFWIATYNDGTALPQFDPESGVENLFKSIDQAKLCKFGWYPFTEVLAFKLMERSILAQARILPYYEIKLKENQRLIAVRRGFIKRFTFHYCISCDHRWSYNKTSPFVPITITQNEKPVTYRSPQCPKCKKYNHLVCPDCKLAISKNSKSEFFCTGCDKKYPRTIKRFEDEERKRIYLLGWQETINGRNYKSISFIKEDGSVIISDELNEEVT